MIATRPSPLRHAPAALAVGLGLATLPGCADPDPGNLLVAPQLGPTDDCEQFGVATVRARLDPSGDDEFEAQEAACGSDLLFERLPAGRYSLLVEGVDADGLTIMDNGGDPDSVRISVPAGGEAEIPALLTATPAKLHVRWRLFLSEGVPAQCTHPDLTIAAFRVAAWDAVGDRLMEAELECEEPPDDNLGYHAIPDPDRLIRGTQVALVDVSPIDDRGDLVDGQSFDFQFEEPGPGRSLFFTVDCTLDACTQSTNPVDVP